MQLFDTVRCTVRHVDEGKHVPHTTMRLPLEGALVGALVLHDYQQGTCPDKHGSVTGRGSSTRALTLHCIACYCAPCHCQLVKRRRCSAVSCQIIWSHGLASHILFASAPRNPEPRCPTNSCITSLHQHHSRNYITASPLSVQRHNSSQDIPWPTRPTAGRHYPDTLSGPKAQATPASPTRGLSNKPQPQPHGTQTP